jgi:hypothetical protein
MSAARQLAGLLADPAGASQLRDWTGLVSAARAESLIGTLGWRLADIAIPEKLAGLLDQARREAAHARTRALWEVEMARRALAPLAIPLILLKGSAYAAAGLSAGQGRSIGDLDILVPRDRLEPVQEALLAAGWEWVKQDPYDDQYYRRWMHELPPLIHGERDRMIDVHHTILPPTARRKPDAEAMIAASLPLEQGLRVLCPADMVVHSAAHLFADGDLAGGLRNLWDIDRLLRDFASADSQFWVGLESRAELHDLSSAVHRAARLANDLYGTPIPESWRVRDRADPLFKARLLARNGWGQATRPWLRLGFYVRSHWMRMPLPMLARHLWTKARR